MSLLVQIHLLPPKNKLFYSSLIHVKIKCFHMHTISVFHLFNDPFLRVDVETTCSKKSGSYVRATLDDFILILSFNRIKII